MLAETVATASHGGVTRVWNALSGQEIHGYYADSAQAMRAVAFSALGSLAVSGDDHRIHLWANGRVCIRETQDRFGLHCLDTPHSLQTHTGAVRTLAVSPDGTFLASGGDDNQLIFWSLHTLAPILIVPQQETITALAWSPSGRFLAGAIGSRILLWQIQ